MNDENNDFDTSFTVVNENQINTKVASMKLSKNTLQFWHSFLRMFLRLLWKSHRTKMTHESTQESKQRLWYDFYCSEFQK